MGWYGLMAFTIEKSQLSLLERHFLYINGTRRKTFSTVPTNSQVSAYSDKWNSNKVHSDKHTIKKSFFFV